MSQTIENCSNKILLNRNNSSEISRSLELIDKFRIGLTILRSILADPINIENSLNSVDEIVQNGLDTIDDIIFSQFLRKIERNNNTTVLPQEPDPLYK